MLDINANFINYIKNADGLQYQLKSDCFLDEVKFSGLIEGHLRARGMASFANYILKAIIMGYPGGPAWVLIAGEVITGTSPSLYEEDGPPLLDIIAGVAALWGARKILGNLAPTLYDKLFWAFIKDLAKTLPNVMSAETFFVFLGHNIGYIGKKGFKGSLVFWKTLLVMAQKVFASAVKLLPKAVGATAASYVHSAKELIAFLVRMGVEIDRAERERIIEEMKEHGPEILDVLRTLEKDLKFMGGRG